MQYLIFQPLTTVYAGSGTVLKSGLYRVLFASLIVSFLALYIMLPVWFIPGNDLEFQLSILSVGEGVILITLSILTALLLTMQIYLFARVGWRAFSDGGGGVLSGVLATMVGVAGCVGCSLGIVLGFLGLGAVLFFNEYQIYIAGGATLLFLVALWLIARRIEGYCLECTVRN